MTTFEHERDNNVNTFVIHECDFMAPMKTIGERLTEVRELRGLTQSELAKKAGVSQGTIGNCESGIRDKPRDLSSIAKALKVSLEWLEFGKGSMELPLNQSADHSDWDDVLGFDQDVGLGTGVEPTEYAEVHKLKFRSDSLQKKSLKSPNLHVFYGKGESMAPRISAGDAVLFDHTDCSHIRDETIYIVMWRGEYYAKRSDIIDGVVYFKSDNPSGDHHWRKAKPKEHPKDPITVIGRVRWIGSWED